VVGREWKARVPELLELYKKDQAGVIHILESIMLKIMVIPAKETKSASELIDIFVKVYDSLLKAAKALEYESLFKLLNEHLETAFKMTSRTEFHLK